MKVAHLVLGNLGATQIFDADITPDPTTEEEFNMLRYQSEKPILWEDYIKIYKSVEQQRGLQFIRMERNLRLSKTDWVMTVDNVETLANKNDWIAYRKALRDLPENPPPFVWNGTYLDFKKMNMPVEPPIIRIPSNPESS